ncbi:MAG: sensor histidine kinase, partial [Anaerolineales bacterium]|nr:sensor histidine kinase [Anaerolineales bacterium]
MQGAFAPCTLHPAKPHAAMLTTSQPNRTDLLATIVVVAAGYITLFLEAFLNDGQGFTWPEIVFLTCAVVLYVYLMVNDEDTIQRFSLSTNITLFFVIEFSLLVLVGLVGRAQGQWWLIGLPLIGYAADLTNKYLLLVSGVMVLVISLVYAYVQGSLNYILFVPLYLTPAIIFVAVFSKIALRERHGREQVEQLAIELQTANQKLSEYAAKVEELVIMQERNRMAREIHDSLGHYLTVVNIQIGAARAIMDKNPAKAQDALQKAQKLTQEGLTEVRHSVAALRAPTQNRPLSDRLHDLVAESQTSGIQTVFEVVGEPRPLSPRLNLTLYRAVQEALTNVRKHAEATHTAVVLDYTDPAQLTLIVRDNGRG